VKAIAKIVSTFFGVGFFPFAPGTVTSVLVVLGFLFVFPGTPGAILWLVVLGLFFLGSWAAGSYAAALALPDPGRIVIDEVCGQLLALSLVPRGRLPAVLAFVFFRIFDIVKPSPLRQLEKLPGGWGIMADDVGAALAAALPVHLVSYLLRVVNIT